MSGKSGVGKKNSVENTKIFDVGTDETGSWGTELNLRASPPCGTVLRHLFHEFAEEPSCTIRQSLGSVWQI